MGYLLFLWYIKKCIFLNVIVGTFYQYLPYFQNKNENRKNMQYENNLRKNVFYREKKKTRFGFQKAFFQKVYLEKGGSSYNQGRLIFGSIRYYYLVECMWYYYYCWKN